MVFDHSQNPTRQMEIHENYWYGVLHNNPKISTFPLDYPRNRKLPDLKGIIRYQIPPEVSRKIIAFGNNSEDDIFVILLTSVIFTLSQYNDGADVLVGILPIVSKATGLVDSNILPMKRRLDLTVNFRDFVTSLRKIFLEAEAHKKIPFRKMQELLGILSLEYTMPPLVNTVVLYKNIHNPQNLEQIHTDNTFSFYREDDRIELELQYNQNLYCQTKSEQVARHIIQFLSMALFNPDIQISAIDLLTPEEKKSISDLPNRTGNDNDAKPIRSECEYIAPQSEIEQKLAAIWEEILGIEKISIHDNFFHLGGDSLLAAKFEVLARERGLNGTSQDLCKIKFLKALAINIANQPIIATPDQSERTQALAKTQDTVKLVDIYHRPKTFYPEYETFCVLNGVRRLIEYHGVEIAPLYINSTLSFAVTLTETKKFGYKLGIQPGIPHVLPSYAKYVRIFAAPARDVHKVWELNKKKLDQGVPLFIGLDIFYLDYIPLFYSQKFHSFHIAILCGYDEKKVYISDWFDPWYYHGAVALEQFLKARSSDNPDDGISRFCGIPIGNYWGEVTPGVWNGKPDELLFETLTLSLKQYTERIEPVDNVFYGADAWKKLSEIIENNKENRIGYTDGSINFLWDLQMNLSLFRDRLKFFNLYLELAAQKINLTAMPGVLDELRQQINRWENFSTYVFKCSKLDAADFPAIIANFKELLSLEEKYLEKVALLRNELK